MHPNVVGIGGIFFRAQDPKRLAAWYEEHLGVTRSDSSQPWESSQGILVFAPFKKDSNYFPAEQALMVNFRVQKMDELLTELAAKRVRIDEKRQDESYGRFAWIYDIEGNKIELWEPL